MFLRILGGFVLLLALIWAVMYATATSALHDAEREPWPYGLGTLQELEARNDRRPPSKEAKEITRLAASLDLEEASPEDYVAAQTSKKDDAIDEPPANVGLKGHEAPIAELVRDAISAGDRIAWREEGPPWQVNDVAYLLGAAALDRARNGDAARAWEDVHATWLLARAISAEPYGADNGLKMKRIANAVARKLPPPAPAWAAELAAFEPRRDTAAVIQQMTAARIGSNPSLPGPFVIFRPISDWIEASNARRSHAAAEAMAKAPRCRIDTAQDLPHTPETYRAARIDAELEATAKVLALKNERARLGKWPPSLGDAGASRCAENHWIYAVKPDGKSMTLRMSWEVAAEPDTKAAALDFAY